MIALLVLSAIQMPPLDLKVVSFNVRYGTAADGDNRWEVRRPVALRVAAEHRADFLCLQEALDFQVKEFASIRNYGVIGVGRDDGKSKGEFSSILYDKGRFRVVHSETFWLSDTPERVASTSWGNRITRICTWARFEEKSTGRQFRLANTHLDHESQPSREKSAGLIIQKMAGHLPVVVTGDYNAGEQNPTAKAMVRGGFRDSWRDLNARAPEPGTFSGFKELGNQKIDYVWVDAAWRVLSAGIDTSKPGGRWPSDHTPVWARIRLK